MWKHIDDTSLDQHHVLLVQEHRQQGEQLITARRRAHAKGWHSHWGTANKTLSSTSGGVAILWRPWIELTAPPVDIVPGRLSIVTLYTAAYGNMMVGSLYATVQETVDEVNQSTEALLGQAATVAREWGKPYVFGGDFNTTPNTIAPWLRRNWGPARCVFTQKPTCASAVGADRTIDYYLMSSILADCVKKVEVSDHIALAPHSVVSATLPNAMLNESVEVKTTIKGGSPEPVTGPCPELPQKVWVEFIERTTRTSRPSDPLYTGHRPTSG